MFGNLQCLVSVLFQNNHILLIHVDGEEPVIDEDIEVKRMKRLELLRARRPYNAISEDGSGWVSLSSDSVNPIDLNNDMSPPRKRRVRNDTPSPEPELNPSTTARKGADFSPSQHRLKRYDTLSPGPDSHPAHSGGLNSDLSPPRKHKVESVNLSPDISPPRRPHHQIIEDNGRKNNDSYDPEDLPPPRRGRHDSPYHDNLHGSAASDLSPPRKSRKDVARPGLSDLSHRRSPGPSVKVFSQQSLSPDLSPPRKNQKDPSIPTSANDRKTGLISGKDIREEIDRKKKDDLLR